MKVCFILYSGYTKSGPNPTEKRKFYPANLSPGDFCFKYNKFDVRKTRFDPEERQRIAIARAILHNPRLLILDEATSSVDTRTEKHIEHGMDRLMADRTTFVIAHRLSTVRNANAIMVLEHGQIIERGDHEDLLAQKGRYFELYTGMKELE